jgi:hypothetical protein
MADQKQRTFSNGIYQARCEENVLILELSRDSVPFSAEYSVTYMVRDSGLKIVNSYNPIESGTWIRE